MRWTSISPAFERLFVSIRASRAHRDSESLCRARSPSLIALRSGAAGEAGQASDTLLGETPLAGSPECWVGSARNRSRRRRAGHHGCGVHRRVRLRSLAAPRSARRRLAGGNSAERSGSHNRSPAQTGRSWRDVLVRAAPGRRRGHDRMRVRPNSAGFHRRSGESGALPPRPALCRRRPDREFGQSRTACSGQGRDLPSDCRRSLRQDRRIVRGGRPRPLLRTGRGRICGRSLRRLDLSSRENLNVGTFQPNFQRHPSTYPMLGPPPCTAMTRPRSSVSNLRPLGPSLGSGSIR